MKKGYLRSLLLLAAISLVLSSCVVRPSSTGFSKSDSSSTVFSENSSSSSASPSSSASSFFSSDSSSSTVSSGSSSVAYSTEYRVAPKKAEVGSDTLNVYSVSFNGVSFTGTAITSLTKGRYYTSYEDVAAYWIGFGELPVNYVCADGDKSSSCKNTKDKYFPTYGEDTRCWFTYHRTDGYMTQVPAYNGDYPTYFELDISSNWSSYKTKRGAYRLMAMPNGVRNYGNDPVIFYTGDHYAHFIEYYNRDGGWGPLFADQSDYVKPETVNSTY